MEIRNDRQLISAMNKVMEDALDAVAGKVLSIIQSYIYQDVYGSGNVPSVYNRTFEFLDSWIKEIDNSDRTTDVVARIFSDSSRMSYEPNQYVHGSNISGDFRSEMARVIEEGLGYKLFPSIRRDGTTNPAVKQRKFFTHTVQELNKSGTLMKWFELEMNARGIELNRKTSKSMAIEQAFYI